MWSQPVSNQISPLRTAPADTRAAPRAQWPGTALRHPTAFCLLLTGLAGYMDAVGFTKLDHLYVSFMSGNSTHLGLSLGTGHWTDAAWVALFVLAFVTGSCLGTRVSDRIGDTHMATVLAIELALFLSAIVLARLDHGRAGLLMVVVAMGLQNVLHQVVAGADIGRSFITGMLFNLGQSLARSRRDRVEARKAALNALSWSAFIAGIILGAHALGTFSLATCLGIAAALVAGMMTCLVSGWL